MPSQWFLHRDGEKIEATPERWQWVATYSDGSVLMQFDNEGVFHQFREIEQDKLVSFMMISEGKPPIMFPFKPGMKLIHCYRNMHLNFGTDEARFIKLYCFGWQRGNEKVMMAIMPDDAVIVVDDINEIEVS